MTDESLLLYGAALHAHELQRTLAHVLNANLSRQKLGRLGTPVCIWGTHGVGKTAIVESFAAEHDWGFAYCAPAQFEEMGDLHGLPTHVQADDGATLTTFAPPQWVPRQQGPGILLLDDINRADERILRGLMQLLQNFEMFSWKLPELWQVVCTANPEGGDYSVTPLDDAMLTRMLHTTLVFDVKAWATWANRNHVDPRGISFALTYPEVITGKRTTPRSLTQFFAQIAEIPDLRKEADLTSPILKIDEPALAATVIRPVAGDRFREKREFVRMLPIVVVEPRDDLSFCFGECQIPFPPYVGPGTNANHPDGGIGGKTIILVRTIDEDQFPPVVALLFIVPQQPGHEGRPIFRNAETGNQGTVIHTGRGQRSRLLIPPPRRSSRDRAVFSISYYGRH